MKISFHGAAQSVTGSKHMIELDNGKKILLDCGMFQGMGPETLELNQKFGFNPLDVDAVIISHAHIDHIGLLPRLVKQGYDGPVYCTEATAAFSEVLLKDSAYIQEMDIRHVNKRRLKKGAPLAEPLYQIQDAAKVFPLFVVKEYKQWHPILEGVSLMYLEAGHILGSATVHIRINENGREQIISFSGDIGRYNDDLLRYPEAFPQADYIILESTYGDKLHPAFKPSVEYLLSEIEQTCLHKKGKLIIPAFSVGRTQELLYALNRLELEHRLPNIKYYLDSPMSIEITELTKHFPNLFNKEVQDVLLKDDDPFKFKGLIYVEDVAQSKKINASTEPAVIISASGMAEAGRVKHHIAHAIEDTRNTILLVGYCEPESLGGRLKAGAKEVGIFGEKYMVNAEVASIESLSAHGDYADLLKWLSCQDPKRVRELFLVHGEIEVQQRFRKRLEEAGFRHISIPRRHEAFIL